MNWYKGCFSGNQQLKAPFLSTRLDKTPLKSVRTNVTAAAEPSPANWQTRALNSIYKSIAFIFLCSAQEYLIYPQPLFPSLAAAQTSHTCKDCSTYTSWQLHKSPTKCHDMTTSLLYLHHTGTRTKQKLPTVQFYLRWRLHPGIQNPQLTKHSQHLTILS